ncbi:MAG: polysaccharide biosynthesis tyrosine autokinase [Solirubrobacteraceae bacterium]
MQSDSTALSSAGDLDLIGTLRVLRRRAPLIALCVVLTAAAAFALSKAQHKQYTATAQILFRNAELDQQAAGLQVVNQSNPQSQTDTNLKLATLPRVAAETAAALDHGLTQKQVSAAITVIQESDTDLAKVSATWTSPARAAQIANTYARYVIQDRQRADANYFASALGAVNLQFEALAPAQRSGVEGADLKDRANSLQILSQLQSDEVALEQAATAPSAPSSPKVLRNTVLGAVLGLLLGLAVAFLLQRLDRRLREPTDLEEVYGVPLLGVVPESTALRQAQGATDHGSELPPNEAEIFGLLRAHIRYFNVDRDLRTVVIVSAAPGDGKSTVARWLAIATATIGSRVLFLEADLRRPMAAKYFGIQREPGVAEVLVGQESLATAVQRVAFASRKETTISLDVLVAGGLLPPNPPQVIESQAMTSLLAEARENYDLVVIDTPPLVLLPDAFPLLRQADGVLIVSRLGENRRDVAVRLRETLAGVDAPVVGVIANGYKRPRGSLYTYGYSYQYDYTQYNGTPAVDVAAQPVANGASPEKAARES